MVAMHPASELRCEMIEGVLVFRSLLVGVSDTLRLVGGPVIRAIEVLRVDGTNTPKPGF